MAFSAADPAVGLEPFDIIDSHTPFLIPGTPGTTHTARIPHNVTAGLLVVAAADAVVPFVYPQKTVATTAATAGSFPRPFKDLVNDDGAKANTLVPCHLGIGRVQRYRATFGSTPTDDTVAAYTAATPSITLTTALGANDDCTGAYVFIYAGPGAGQWNVCTDYVDGTKVVTLAHPFAVPPTSASSVLIFEGEGGGVGAIGPFGRIALAATGVLDADDGYNDGTLVVCMSGEEVTQHMTDGNLLVITAGDFGWLS